MGKLTLYSRPECHLCEALLADLMPLLARPDDSVETVDVDSSVALERRYGLRIPVLVAGEVELSGYPLDRERVRRLSRVACSRRKSRAGGDTRYNPRRRGRRRARAPWNGSATSPSSRTSITASPRWPTGSFSYAAA